MNKQQAIKANKVLVAKLVRELAPATKAIIQASDAATQATDASSTVILKQIEKHKDQLKQLIPLFNVTAGSPGTAFEIGDEGYFTRDQYIRQFWRCTPQHLLQVIGLHKKSDPKPDEDKPLYKKGEKAGIAKATSPTFVKDMKDDIHRRDERRITATRDVFTDAKHEHSFPNRLFALLDMIDAMPESVSIAFHNLAKEVRGLFGKASDKSLQQVNDVEDLHKPSTDKFFANPTETGTAFPATPKGAQPPKVILHDMSDQMAAAKKRIAEVPTQKERDRAKSFAVSLKKANKKAAAKFAAKLKREAAKAATTTTAIPPTPPAIDATDCKYIVAVYKASDGCRYGVFLNNGRMVVRDDGKPCVEALQNYATAKEAEANIAERLEKQAKAAAATSGEVI
jgi:hypothetical protein